MKVIEVEAKVQNISMLTAFVEEVLEAVDCPLKAQMQLSIAIDEIASNIVYYAYPSGQGKIRLEAEYSQNPKGVILRFIDWGLEYNPLEHEDPDISLSVEERKVGGLGIFLVKKTMDRMEYARKDQINELTIQKFF